MKTEWSPSIGPLQGKYVFLSASVPELARDRGFLSGPLEDTLMLRVIDERVDDAVQSFVAQVLGAGGRIVHGGHPKIVRLIANQAGNWIVGPQVKEPPICIYQSTFYRHLPPPPGRDEMEEAHLAIVRWVSATWEQLAARNELPPSMVNGWLPMQAPERARPGTREALMAMRLEMLLDTKPVSGVCIGGMEGITAEAKLYLALARMEKIPFASEIHVMRSTFGATGQLEGDGIRPADLDVHVQSLRAFTANPIDRRDQLPRQTESFAEEISRPVSKETAIEDFQKRISYGSTMRRLVKSIANTRSR